MLVIGDREVEQGTVSVRHRKHADLGAKPVDEVVAQIRALNDNRTANE
jgi:threonyl-tRNA synthetase